MMSRKRVICGLALCAVAGTAIVAGLSTANAGGFAVRDESRIIDHGPGEIECVRVSLSGCPLDCRSTRIVKPKNFRDFVEGFSGGIVARASEDTIFQRRLTFNQVGMSTGCHKSDERELHVGVRDEVCEYVAFQMINRDKRLLPDVGK